MSNDEELEKILNELKNGKGADKEPDFSINENNDGVKQAEATEESYHFNDNEQEEPVKEKEPSENDDFSEFDLEEEDKTVPAKASADGIYISDMSAEEYSEEDNMVMDKQNKKKIIIAIIAVLIVAAIAVGVYFGVINKEKEPETTAPATTVSTTAAPVIIRNPLTGEPGYSEAALKQRPISVVVENAKAARPQYNMDTPDIIVEGEVEGGETRMLWFYSDYNNLPEMIGPNRSARPSYVQFSKFFDSIFVHYGGSHSKGDYVGGYETIESEGVDDIDGMKVSSCFKRTKDKVSPHNAVVLGDKLMEAVENKGYRTEVDKNSFSTLNFNETAKAVSATPCDELKVKISERTNTHTLSYNSENAVYTNENDYGAPVSFTNVLVMFAESTYIDKANYKGSGKTETYLNYTYSSGTGKLASHGAVVDFNWSVENGKLVFKDTAGKPLMLNPGKTWICLASSNHNGKVDVVAAQASSSAQ